MQWHLFTGRRRPPRRQRAALSTRSALSTHSALSSTVRSARARQHAAVDEQLPDREHQRL